MALRIERGNKQKVPWTLRGNKQKVPWPLTVGNELPEENKSAEQRGMLGGGLLYVS